MENNLLEFTEKKEWSGWNGGGTEIYTEVGAFAVIEWKYFEGWNPPFQIIDGKREPIESASARLKRWFAVPVDQRIKLINETTLNP